MTSTSFLLDGVTMLLTSLLLAMIVCLYVVAGYVGDLRDREAPLARRMHG